MEKINHTRRIKVQMRNTFVLSFLKGGENYDGCYTKVPVRK